MFLQGVGIIIRGFDLAFYNLLLQILPDIQGRGGFHKSRLAESNKGGPVNVWCNLDVDIVHTVCLDGQVPFLFSSNQNLYYTC